MDSIRLRPIGVAHTPHKTMAGTPIQPKAAQGVEGTLEIFPEYEMGLKDLDGFSHIIVLFYLHLASETKLEVIPYMDTTKKGVFATRAPVRPNHIGLSVLDLVGISGGFLQVRNVDLVDGSPILDIKPYVPNFDEFPDNPRFGWLEENVQKLPSTKADERF